FYLFYYDADNDRDSSDSDDVKVNDENQLNSSFDDDDFNYNIPSKSQKLTSNSKSACSKRRNLKPITKIPIVKKSRLLINDEDDQDENQNYGFQQVLHHVKELNAIVLQVQKQQSQMSITMERQHKFLNSLCVNQKKIVRSFNKHKIPIVLEDDDEETATHDEESTNALKSYNRSDGQVIDLLKIYGTKQNTIKYALKLIDVVFIDDQEFQNINVKKADEDERIKAIRNAVQHKFGFSVNDMSIIWPPIHDSILSKRRNQRKRLYAKSNKDASNDPLVASNSQSET
ncbi:unnamed protein product, partial [Rotaria magnacalcarata]